jgi:hypothetical protein
MITIPRLLCVALFATAAYAQSSSPDFVTSDPSLAHEFQTTPAPAAKPSPEVHVLPTPAAAMPKPDLQLRSIQERPVLPTATVLRLKLNRAISTASARPGQEFSASLAKPVEVDGQIVIPAGTSVNCQLQSAHGARRFAGKPSLSIKALSVRMPSGEQLTFSATVVDTGNPRHLDVDQEGRVRGATPNPMDNIELGALAGAGAVAGAVFAGPEGLLIGTASGAVLAVGHIIVKHRDLTLPAGTELIFELDSPATTARPQLGGEL